MDQQGFPADPPTLPGQLNEPATTQPADLPYPNSLAPDLQQYPMPLPYQTYPLQPLHASENDLPQLKPAQPPAVVSTGNLSFTGKAAIALLLYFLFYIPGLIANIMFIAQANRVRKETGQTPSGIGCLWATLLVSIVPLATVLVIITLFILQFISASGHPHSSVT